MLRSYQRTVTERNVRFSSHLYERHCVDQPELLFQLTVDRCVASTTSTARQME
jgi:hypothetical protein